MDILEIPIEWLIAFVFVLTAVFVLLRGLRLPSDFANNEKARSELRKKINELERQFSNSGNEKKDID